MTALKPGDKVGDGCVVVPIKTINGIKLMCVETIEWLEDDQPSSDDIVDVLRSIRAALDTGET